MKIRILIIYYKEEIEIERKRHNIKINHENYILNNQHIAIK